MPTAIVRVLVGCDWQPTHRTEIRAMKTQTRIQRLTIEITDPASDLRFQIRR